REEHHALTAARVHDEAQVLRCMLALDLLDEPGDTPWGVRVHSVLREKGAGQKREVGAVDQRIAVDQEQSGALGAHEASVEGHELTLHPTRFSPPLFAAGIRIPYGG